ncbi:unnamed protein product [Adineta ricciae]|uniref:G-protein coupled receptors family 1 profile domain-containing protein n=1 Tax=Adineta ricciae TaxID=249248 RepID=A0A814P9M6_ADIRI|nr:unnamed protein product [Adineta ricciae]
MSSSSTKPDEYHEQVVAFALSSVLLSICICGVLGNALVLGVGIYKQKYRKNVTNCFIMNLAVADLSFLLTSVPLTSYLGLSKLWIFGEFICKMNIYLAHVFLQATCYTLATMSIDRYLYMVHVVWYRKYRTPKHTLIICVSIWIISLLFMFPYKHVLRMIMRTHTGSRHTLDCSVYDRDSLFSSCIFTFGFYYVLPLSIIAICYLRVFMWVQSATYHGQKSLVSSTDKCNIWKEICIEGHLALSYYSYEAPSCTPYVTGTYSVICYLLATNPCFGNTQLFTITISIAS